MWDEKIVNVRIDSRFGTSVDIRCWLSFRCYRAHLFNHTGVHRYGQQEGILIYPGSVCPVASRSHAGTITRLRACQRHNLPAQTMPITLLPIIVLVLWMKQAWSLEVIAREQVQIDGSGGTTTTKETSSYPMAVIQLANTFPKGVLTSEDLELRVAAKIENLKKEEFLLEFFALADSFESSLFLARMKNPTPSQFLETLGQITIVLEETSAKFDGKDDEAILKILAEDETWHDLDPSAWEDYRRHPKKFPEHHQQFLSYELAAVAEAAGYLEIETMQHAAPVFLSYR